MTLHSLYSEKSAYRTVQNAFIPSISLSSYEACNDGSARASGQASRHETSGRGANAPHHRRGSRAPGCDAAHGAELDQSARAGVLPVWRREGHHLPDRPEGFRSISQEASSRDLTAPRPINAQPPQKVLLSVNRPEHDRYRGAATCQFTKERSGAASSLLLHLILVQDRSSGISSPVCGRSRRMPSRRS
jgi:hypothetical protein